jgi:hypothetical protein
LAILFSGKINPEKNYAEINPQHREDAMYCGLHFFSFPVCDRINKELKEQSGDPEDPESETNLFSEVCIDEIVCGCKAEQSHKEYGQANKERVDIHQLSVY